MALLALDVAFSNCGWVVFKKGAPVECGVIVTEKSKNKTTRQSDDSAHRSSVLANELRDIISRHGIKGVIGELPSGGALSASAIKNMALATGAIAATIAMMDLPVEWTDPGSVKKATTGMRAASKEEMMEEIRTRFPDFAGFPKTKCAFEHIADACGVYLALKTGNLVKMFG